MSRRLTKLERDLLRRSAEFVLAGEWPWDEGDSAKEVRKVERERSALLAAVIKLEPRP